MKLCQEALFNLKTLFFKYSLKPALKAHYITKDP